MAKKTQNTPARKPYTSSDVKLLKAHLKARTPVSKLSKMMKRSEGSLRRGLLSLGSELGINDDFVMGRMAATGCFRNSGSSPSERPLLASAT